jgi:hypothetical protein
MKWPFGYFARSSDEHFIVFSLGNYIRLLSYVIPLLAVPTYEFVLHCDVDGCNTPFEPNTASLTNERYAQEHPDIQYLLRIQSNISLTR